MEVRLGNIFGFSGGNYAGNVYDKDFIAPTLNTMQGGGRQPMIIANINPSGNGINGAVHTVDAEAPTITTNKGEGNKIIVAMRGRNPENPSDRTVGLPTEQRLEPNSQGICNTLTSVQKDNLVMESSIVQLSRGYNNGGEHKICPSITSHSWQENNFLNNRYRIRKLTPLECWRLMDFDDMDFIAAKVGNRDIAMELLKIHLNHQGKSLMTEAERISKMSNTQLYKQAGNSIIRNVLVAIIGQMIPGKEEVYKNI